MAEDAELLPQAAARQSGGSEQGSLHFSPRGCRMVGGDISGGHNRGTGSSAGIQGVEAGEAAEHFPGHRTAPLQRMS